MKPAFLILFLAAVLPRAGFGQTCHQDDKSCDQGPEAPAAKVQPSKSQPPPQQPPPQQQATQQPPTQQQATQQQATQQPPQQPPRQQPRPPVSSYLTNEQFDAEMQGLQKRLAGAHDAGADRIREKMGGVHDEFHDEDHRAKTVGRQRPPAGGVPVTKEEMACWADRRCQDHHDSDVF